MLVLAPSVASEAALAMVGGASSSSWAAARPEAPEVVAQASPSGRTVSCYMISQSPTDVKPVGLDRVPSWQARTGLTVQCRPDAGSAQTDLSARQGTQASAACPRGTRSWGEAHQQRGAPAG